MNPEVDPAHIIRAYVWRLLEVNDPETWNTEKYDGKQPIVPLGEEPELVNMSGPYIVYVNTHSPNDIPCSTGGMTLAINDDDFRRMGRTINIIRTALDRSDDSATDVNNFSTNFQVAGNYPFLGLRFGYIRAMFTEGPIPSETEGGRALATIDLDYEYYVDYDVITSV